MLDTDADDAAARAIGRTRNAVAQKRFALGIPKVDRRRRPKL
ncbi:hypothetical protein FTUN_7664 [Frigoriglobus tundricola]|uniref:Uncharacterized protein n=1 Tax=Frigoriglobus tundricola TaxID=2774151 RepID=A0A6M5Z3C3_9BACT|nr:hypothetical protein FTUN_7664 [Frigoriglobus tundricola]